MNYRHIYHAGNFADCLKHIILSRILQYLQKKDKPFFVLDTHAGIGSYDLTSEEARKTGEWQDGIARLLGKDAHPVPDLIKEIISPYADVIKSLNPEGEYFFYPGSPKLVQMMTREQDRAFFMEKHQEDFKTLAKSLRGDHRMHVRQDDGWLALKATLPPKERRGLVLIDPPFEEPDEYRRMIEAFLAGYKRWSTGTYCLWYPIKARRDVDVAAQMLADAGIENCLRVELVIQKLDTAKRLNGTGLFIINPPFTLHADLKLLLPFLAKTLGQTAQRSTLEWICEPK
ncbi:23S rRNA (adenine(2030)-N(6))-methyltransferase RlmJ [uncultured Cohaesibacter sp.]|uniref:23S rRNA (adenine(2030)-N(6))-methyltransferase RlmJ n=1 Tax=uncultured Cohaesibacter sp. TaxID=1002546 RepID=UPI0029315DF7|nr:23S rRNA (adenine(2030)-N(6))-methyltransferase RlmJ [uncultured Cohaesibacter sp.]